MSELNASDYLAHDGAFADLIDGFSPRTVQQQMADTIERALLKGQPWIAEAGTGTGKTFAYLAPALLSAGCTVVSTGTRPLQDQLFHRDLPQVQRALGSSRRAALLKGRSNYLCWYRLNRSLEDGQFRNPEEADHLVAMNEWANITRSGDIVELTEVPESSMLWSQVTSTADNCLGQECDHYSDCFLVQARRRAQEADLIVVNHHLLCADLSLRDEGVGELLPEADAFIVDEAHQLPEVASLFFGESITARQLMELSRDATAEVLKSAGETRDVMRQADKVQTRVREARLSLGRRMQRIPWANLSRDDHVQESFAALHREIESLNGLLEPMAQRSRGLESCWRRSTELGQRLEQLVAPDDEESVRWLDIHSRSFVLNRTPLDIAEQFRTRTDEQGGTWIFTSATLAVDERFDHFASQLGFEDAGTSLWASPFDFAQQSLLYQPKGLPEPNDPGYTGRVVDAAVPVLNASEGRAFFLFTSYRALDEAAALLADQVNFPLFVQGSKPRSQLLQEFRDSGNGVLLGTSSFWEGVDVRGSALSCVIIDKLPFAAPSDPVLQARIQSCRKSGGTPFMELQLPAAVIALKQGVGRLIRDTRDHGVLMLCDPRLRSKGYGKTFINSLPAMPATQSIADVEVFFDGLAGADLSLSPECP